MPRNLLVFTLVFFQLSFNSGLIAQSILNGCAQGNLGVDADLYANGSQFGGAIGISNTDDWFYNPAIYSGNGLNIIDTTGNYQRTLQLLNNENISFSQRMEFPLNTIITGNRWLDAVYARDYFSILGVRDATAFSSSKNGEDPNAWSGGQYSVSNKSDLIDCFAHIRRTGVLATDSLWFYIGISRVGNTGNSYFDTEIYVDSFSYDTNSGFYSAGAEGGHTSWLFNPDGSIARIGDLAISVTFGNDAADIEVRIWVSQSDYINTAPQSFSFGSQFNGSTYGYADIILLNEQLGCGLINVAPGLTPAPPWGSVNSNANYDVNYDEQQFVEVGLNLTSVGIDPFLNAGNACEAPFHSIIFKSRSSLAFSSSLEDFSGPYSFGQIPMIQTEAQGDTITCQDSQIILQAVDPHNSGFYEWSTIDGNILSNPDSTHIFIDQPGTYILSGSPLQGCAPVYDTIVVPIDTIPPNVNTSGNIIWDCIQPVQIYGGEDNQLYNWTGPDSFNSMDQNPMVNEPGAYQLAVTKISNGCISDTTDSNSFAIVLAEPCETDDYATVNEDSLVSIQILSNDYDLDNNIDTSSIVIINGPNNGTVTITNGIVDYVPFDDYNGVDSFDYILCDFDNLCDTATVFITVQPVCDLLNANLTVACLDNNTGILNDDLFTFTLQPSGNDLGTSYSISGDLSDTGLPYSMTSPAYGPFLISDGSLVITLTDDSNAGCQLSDILLAPPAPCSICDVQIDSTMFIDLSACLVIDGIIEIFASSSYPIEFSINDGQTWSNNPVFSNLSAGSYKIIVRNIDGSCPVTYNLNPIILSEPGGPLIDSISIFEPTCPAGNINGIISIHATAEGDSLEYSVDNGQNYQVDSVFTNLAPGFYDITIRTINGGCITVYTNNSVELAVPFCPEICNDGIDNDGNGLTDCEDSECNPDLTISLATDFNGYNISCQGESDGAVEAIPNAGTGPFTYQWNDPLGQTTATASGLSAGTFMVIVSDFFGCVDTGFITLTEPLPINLVDSLSNYNGFNVSCFGGTDGTATVIPSGGIPPYSYLWNDPLAQTTATASSLSTSNYSITVTDANNCTTVHTVNLTQPALPLSLVFSVNDLTCNGLDDGSINLTVGGGVPSYSYIWSNGSTTENIDSLTPGIYILTVEDINNCLAIDSVNILEPSLIDIIANSTSTSACGSDDGIIIISASGGSGLFEFSIDNINWQSNDTFYNLAPGSYSIYVRNNDGSCPTYYINNPLIINDPDLPQVNISIQEISCSGFNDGAIILNPSSGVTPFSFSWSTGQNGNSINNLNAGTYFVTYTDANNCNNTDTITLVDPQNLTLSTFISEPSNCSVADGLIVLLAQGGSGSFEYSLDGINWTTSNSFSSLNIGEYQAYVRNIDGSCQNGPLKIILSSNTQVSCPIDVPTPLPLESQISTPTLSANNSSCGNGIDWDPLNNYNISDDLYIVADAPKNNSTSCLMLSGFNFNIPPGATITGISLHLEGHYEGIAQISDLSIRLFKDSGSLTGENKASKFWNFGTDENWSYGDSTDMWLTNLTQADIEAPGFGISIQTKAANIAGSPNFIRGIAMLDNVILEVHYQPTFQVCNSETAQIFTATEINDSTVYTWTIPSGTQITNGQGNSEITVNLNGIAPGYYDVCVDTQIPTDQCNPSGQCCYTFEVLSCPEICDDGIDNDGDGLIDCMDPACSPDIDSISVFQPTCPVNNNNGSILIFANVPSGDSLLFSIDNGTTFQSDSAFINLPPGTYNIIVMNSAGSCQSTYSANPVVLVAPSCPEICDDGIDNDGDGLIDCMDPACSPDIDSISVFQPTCPVSNNNGSILIFANVPSGDSLLFSIDNGTTFQSDSAFINLPPGTYNIIVMNSAGSCQSAYSANPIVLVAPSCPEICDDGIDNDGDGLIDCEDEDCIPGVDSLQISPTSDCGLQDAFIKIFTSESNIEFSIDNGQTWQDSCLFEGLSFGTYQLIIRNTAGGCEFSYSGNPIVIEGLQSPLISELTWTNPTACQFFDGTISISTNNFDSLPIQYSINGGVTWSSDSIFQDLSAAEYDVIVQYSGTNFCIDTSSVILSDPQNCIDTVYITIEENSPVDTCLNDFIELPGTLNSIELCSPTDSIFIFFNDTIPCITIEELAVFQNPQVDCIVVCDDNFICDTVIIITTLIENNSQVVALPECVSTMANSDINIAVLTNDTLHGDLTEIGVLQPPIYGEAIWNEDSQTFTYVPSSDNCGHVDTFTYYISNGVFMDTSFVCVETECIDIIIYTAVSPNGDNINDYFTIENIEFFPGNEVTIFNRWGNQVAYFRDYKNDWNGSWGNKAIPDGTYFFIIKLPDHRQFKGYLELYR